MKLVQVVALLTLAVACTISGYFLGREHVKFQLRVAMQEAAEGIVQASAPQKAENRNPTPLADTSRVELIGASLGSKSFHQSDQKANDFQDVINFSIDFENKSGKYIRAYDGEVTFTDLLDNKIFSAKIAINDPLKSGGKETWRGGINYNQFEADHRALRGADLVNLKMNFAPRKILYVDGSTQSFTQ